MPDSKSIDKLEVWVGGFSRVQLLSRLSAQGILMNAHAETLLQDMACDGSAAQQVVVTERTVAELGLSSGGTLPRIFEAAQQQGLLLCPVEAGPYLRLVLNDQDSSLGSVMSSGRAPDGGLTVAAQALHDNPEYPKGFYLRVVEDRSWLRGYRCDDNHVWSPSDRFIFQLPPP